MPKRNLIWIVILLAMTAVLLLVWHHRPGGPTVTGSRFAPVRKTYEVICDRSYPPADEGRLKRGAVRGMVGQLDRFSSYCPPDHCEALTGRVMGVDRGLGLRLDFPVVKGPSGKTPAPRIIGAVFGSPAHKARLLPGDRILTINDTPTTGRTERQVRNMLAGKVGDKVKLTILTRKDKRRTVTLTHAEFPVQTVRGLYRNRRGKWVWLLPVATGRTPRTAATNRAAEANGNLAYVRITEFCPQTPRRLRQALSKLGHLRGLVLDLRSNPGGVLQHGVATTDVFLREGDIVTIVGRNNHRVTHAAHDETPFATTPMAVLIDENTASAAEIVAGALGANARAVLVGQRTRGKGCIQSMIQLPEGLGQVNLTTGEFFVVPYHPIHRRDGTDTWGVGPHVRQAISPKDRGILTRLWVEAEIVPAPPEKSKSSATRPSRPPDPRNRLGLGQKILQHDPQLVRAVKLLSEPEKFQAMLRRIEADEKTAAEAWKKAQARRSGKSASKDSR